MYVAKCLCGPRRTSLRFIAKDARKALNNDPTGTRALQRRWSTALDQRWRSIDKMLPQAIARYLDPVDMLSHAASFGSNPVQAFQGWLDEAMRQVIVGTNGAWMLPYVRSATDAGFVHAKRTEPKPVADAFSPDQPRDNNGKWTNSGDSNEKWNSGTASTAKSMPPHVLNGVAFAPYHHEGDWAHVKGQANIQEPPLPALRPAQQHTSKNGTSYTIPGDRLSSGVIMHEPDGRVWLTKPSNGFGGYKHSWPKGGVEEGLHPQANAIKEAYEETGLKARITGFAGDFKGDTGVTRMYHAVRVGGHPADKGWESEAVVLARKQDLGNLLNRSRDQKIANTIHGVNIQPKPKPIYIKKDAAPPADRTNLLQTFAITELQGIVEAVSQQLVRAFAAGLLAKQSAQQITRAARQVISTVGIRRGRMLASFMCVRAFNAAALDGYRAQGLTHVGIDPERKPMPSLTSDAKGSGKGGRTKKAEKKLQQSLGEGDVDVLTAEDNDVCDECDEIAQNGPYSLDEAEDLIPAHPNCRCAFIPADESAHESDDLEDAFNPNEPREQDGKWTSGGDLEVDKGKGALGSVSGKDSEKYKSIKWYQEEGYASINKSLRSGKTSGRVSQAVRDIDSVIARSTIKQDLTVYRGVDATKKFDPTKFAIDKVITLKGFVSTTVSQKVAQKFEHKHGVTFEISVPKGTKALEIKSNEHELLLGHDSKFRIKGVSGTTEAELKAGEKTVDKAKKAFQSFGQKSHYYNVAKPGKEKEFAAAHKTWQHEKSNLESLLRKADKGIVVKMELVK